MGDRGVEQAMGGDISCMEGGHGVAGGGDHQLQSKCGKLLANVGVEEIVCRGGVRAPTLCDRFPPHRAGVVSGAKGDGGHPVG